MGTFHFTFFESLQVVGASPSAIPVSNGPRQRGQSASFVVAGRAATPTIRPTVKRIPVNRKAFVFIIVFSSWPCVPAMALRRWVRSFGFNLIPWNRLPFCGAAVADSVDQSDGGTRRRALQDA